MIRRYLLAQKPNYFMKKVLLGRKMMEKTSGSYTSCNANVIYSGLMIAMLSEKLDGTG
jgi:hypothetical protein